MEEVASRYGMALFSLALELNQVDSFQEEVKAWREVFKDNQEIYEVLSSRFLGKDERKEIFEKISHGMNPHIHDFLMIVIDNNRMSNLDDILLAFNTYCNEHKGIKEGYVYSVSPLDKKTIETLNNKISKLEKVKVELHNVIDKSLIGGIKVIISDHVYDDSLKFHLDNLRQSLMKKEDALDEN